MKTLADFLDEYLEHGRGRGRSPVHLRGQRFVILRTLRWLESVYQVSRPDQLTRGHLTAWTKQVSGQRTSKGFPLKPRSIAKQFDTDRKFVGWLETRGLLPSGLREELPNIKVPDLLPISVLTHQQMLRLIAGVDVSTPQGCQLRAALEVLYSSGLRVSELLGMDVASVDLAAGVARVLGKGGKERVVPVGATALRHLESYLKGVRPMFIRGPSEAALWLGSAGGRLPYHTFRRQLLAVAKESRLPVHVTAHTFRRSCATELIRGGANLWHVKDLLGHENVDTLNHYVRLMIVDLKKTHARCHPREREKSSLAR
jgi:integrase/recombinase XerD